MLCQVLLAFHANVQWLFALELFQQLVAIAPCRTYFLECRGLELLMQPALLSPRSAMLLDAPVDTQYPRWLTLSRLSTFVRVRLE